ncbi:hypothetical protein BCR33DRAFT_857539 [Rhizoclosmatium globosum]|uniref:Nucleotide-diphospho-sugar transferase domain-containing protein n=1 Tax=Rhizoclosmatium globosum TaxID=329046 RepID=A0A1Y2B527_9FUNG|nr:hypothetical protein BCR33DRAFT_857539 [Rhizoclosmatium globosum]|eukprot:ORY29933.1 hypothetical protein BCR33DRAFT_857539 [Rhizoclosmatium globosum]
MVSTLGLNFIFTDLDTVFLRDPFVALNIPHGISNVTFASMDAPEGNTTLGSLFDLVPDIVYSTDARTFFHYMVDPDEGNQRIPRIWLNDQYGMEKLLDDKNSGFDSVMVNPFPAGIEERKDPRPVDEVVNATQVVRVRVLSQAAFRSALPYYEDAGIFGDDYPMLIKELESRGEYEVFYHPNYWMDAITLPYGNSKNKTLTKHIKQSGNKEEAMRISNRWYLNANVLSQNTLANTNQISLAREQVPVLYIRNETSIIVDEKAWFTGRYRNDTVMLASANFGAAKSPMLANMLCSLAKNSPKTLDSFVIWATDIEAAYFLGNISTTYYKSLFGVYYYDVNLPLDFASGDSDNEKYMQLMAGRNAFFERMVSTLGLNFIFTDLDTVFLKDPFVALNAPYGVSNVSVTSMDALEGNTTLGSLFDVVPDLVYSTDARTFFHLMIDPYEGNQRIPKICGGFFFIRSNERTIRLWKHMLEEGLNDQYGMEKLLDDKNSGFDSVMVNPLPAGIEKRKDPRSEDKVVNAQVVRVRILSQAAFRNSLPYYEDAGMVGDDYPMLIKELESRGEYEVFYHPNYWIDADVFELPYDNSKNKTLTKRIKHNGNKEEAMKVANQWYLNENGTCPHNI